MQDRVTHKRRITFNKARQDNLQNALSHIWIPKNFVRTCGLHGTWSGDSEIPQSEVEYPQIPRPIGLGVSPAYRPQAVVSDERFASPVDGFADSTCSSNKSRGAPFSSGLIINHGIEHTFCRSTSIIIFLCRRNILRIPVFTG